MQTTMTSPVKRLRWTGSLIATLAVTAVLAGTAMPAAFPATASAVPRNQWCAYLSMAFEGAWERKEWAAVNAWRQIIIDGGCI
jgi:hypothetical protein